MIPLLDTDKMEEKLNSEMKAVAFPSSAVTGLNVFKTVRYIAKETVKNVIEKTAFSSYKIG